MGGLFGPMMQGVFGKISDSLNQSHKEQLDRESKEIDSAKSLYETLVKMGGEGRAIGLTGLSSLIDPKERKKAIANANRFISGTSKMPKFKDAEKVTKEIEETTKKSAPSYSVNPPPEMSRDAAGVKEASTVTTAPPEPIQMSAALPTSTPSQGGQMNSTPGVTSAPPEADYSHLQYETERYADKTLDTRKDIASENNAARLDIAEKRIAANIANKSQQDSPYVLSGVEADMAGVPDGTAVNPKVFTALLREQGANLRTAAQASLTRELEAGRNSRTGSFTPEWDGDGNLLGYNNPKTGTTQAPGFAGARKPRSAGGEATVTGKKRLLQDVGELKEMMSGRDDLIGAGEGAKQRLKQFGSNFGISRADPTWAAASDLLNRMATGQLYELTGKAAAEWERAGIRRMVPQIDTLESSPQLFWQQVEGFQRAAEKFLDTYQGGVPREGKGTSAPPAAPAGMRKIGDTKKFTSGPYTGKTGTWNGSGWEVPD